MNGFRDYQSVIQAGRAAVTPPGACPSTQRRSVPCSAGWYGKYGLPPRSTSWTVRPPRRCSSGRTGPGSGVAGDGEMSETCDRCGPAVGAAYRLDRIGELYLCGRCASRQWRALSAQGWTFWPLGVHALAPQASAVPDAAGL